jgi:hypothetical protein
LQIAFLFLGFQQRPNHPSSTFLIVQHLAPPLLISQFLQIDWMPAQTTSPTPFPSSARDFHRPFFADDIANAFFAEPIVLFKNITTFLWS